MPFSSRSTQAFGSRRQSRTNLLHFHQNTASRVESMLQTACRHAQYRTMYEWNRGASISSPILIRMDATSRIPFGDKPIPLTDFGVFVAGWWDGKVLRVSAWNRQPRQPWASARLPGEPPHEDCGLVNSTLTWIYSSLVR